MMKVAIKLRESMEIEKYYKKNKPDEYKKYKRKYYGKTLLGGFGGAALGIAGGIATKSPKHIAGAMSSLGGAAGAFIGGQHSVSKMYNRDTLNKVRAAGTMKTALSLSSVIKPVKTIDDLRKLRK